MGINKVMLLGNLGKDPEIRYTPQQMAVCRFSLATGERKKDQSGNWVDHTEWHNVVVFGKVAENCAKYLKKGRQAFIEGRIRTNKWQDKEGKDRYTTEILANQIKFVGSKGDYAGPSAASAYPDGNPFEDLKSADDISAEAGAVTFDDDDIPF